LNFELSFYFFYFGLIFLDYNSTLFMSDVTIIGCGIVGAAIAYELSKLPNLNITVIDQNMPAKGSTGAALGVLMGVISHQVKGRGWQLRSQTMQRYETLIPELEKIIGCSIPFNRQGILMLCFVGENLTRWQDLIQVRQAQDLKLQLLTKAEIQTHYPQVNCDQLSAAIYSPQDRQVDPTALTLALINAAQKNGVTFQFNTIVKPLKKTIDSELQPVCYTLETTSGTLKTNWVILATGLGTTPLLPTAVEQKQFKIRPVLGQALRLKLNQPLGEKQPVITGDDVHIVPLKNNEYWIGATVEFPENDDQILPDSSQLDAVLTKATTICPQLSQGQILQTWSGLRPRPDGQPAPIIRSLPGYSNILLATGHYRNGVLLAPVTAQEICHIMQSHSTHKKTGR
jgi:glycine/D-amino acid oxidase-like deaminating enzyme